MTLYMLRYSEISLKSRPVRRRWEDALIRQLKDMDKECKVWKSNGRIWIKGEIPRERLKKVFGIVSFSECERCALSELSKHVLDFCERKGFSKTESFAVRVRRKGTHDFTSQQKAAELGALIQKRFKGPKVDLKHPTKEVFIEIRDDDCYIFDEVIRGAGGIPLGVEGKVVSLFSGGIDSPVATWMMMKRGCEVIPIYFDISPFADEEARRRAERVAEVLAEYQPSFRLRVEKHGNFLNRVKNFLTPKGLERYTCILCKRRMYKVAEKLAVKEGAKGLVTGENLGQVASQTLDNLSVLDGACELPVFRPLIGFDKVEIEGLARKIGTFEVATLDVGGCKAAPRKPATKSKLERILELEMELGENP